MNLSSITITAKDFIRGASPNDNISVGGLSPDQKGINLFADQGTVLHPQPSATDLSTNLEDEVINMVVDPSFGGDDAFLLDDSGKFYTLSGTTLTKRQTDAVNTYTFGTSKLIVFKGAVFATSNTDIAKLGISSLNTIDHDWWTNTEGNTALDGSYRHDMEVVEDTLFVADRYYLHTWNGTTSVEQAMTLPTNINITALHKHPDGRSLIAFASETANYSHNLKSKAYIYIIDTNTLEFTREIEIDDQTEGVIKAAGQIFVTYGRNLGIMNGDSYSFLREISKPTLGGVYKGKMTNFDGVMMVADDNSVLAYGDINGFGDTAFFPYFNNDNGNTITSIMALGGKQLLVSYATSQLKLLDFDNTDGLTEVKTGVVKFPGKVWVRRVVPLLESALEASSDIEFSIYDGDENETEVGTMDHTTDGAVKEKRMDCNILTSQMSLGIDWKAVPKGVKQITIFYESGE